jgi:hypothetical protein
MKVRLDLTVQQKFKDIARELAKKRRRSISALFEDLIEREMIRETQKKIWQTHIRHVPGNISYAASAASFLI